jgi:hypothetical protein
MRNACPPKLQCVGGKMMNDEVTKRNRTTGQGCAISVWGIYKGNLVVIPTRPVAAMSGIVTFVD